MQRKLKIELIVRFDEAGTAQSIADIFGATLAVRNADGWSINDDTPLASVVGSVVDDLEITIRLATAAKHRINWSEVRREFDDITSSDSDAEDDDDETIKQQMGVGIFSGDMANLDVDRAIAELERAGFRVLRMPDRLIPTLAVPGDYFVEIYFECTDDEVNEIWQRLRRIVSPYGGDVDSVGAVEEGHVPFKECFGSDAWEH